MLTTITWITLETFISHKLRSNYSTLIRTPWQKDEINLELIPIVSNIIGIINHWDCQLIVLFIRSTINSELRIKKVNL